jgi:hypothetical protein
MVQTFQAITRSLEDKKDSPASDALAHAAQQLSKETVSGSGKLYAQNLATAATQLKGQTIDPNHALQLLQTLIGGGQSQQPQQQAGQSAGVDILGSLLGGLTGAEQSQPQQQAPQPAGGDLLGSLLGGLTSAGNAQASNTRGAPANTGLDMGDLLKAGMAYMQARQSGGTNTSALIQAVVAGSGMGNSNHRTQSTQLVAGSFLRALGALTGKPR